MGETGGKRVTGRTGATEEVVLSSELWVLSCKERESRETSGTCKILRLGVPGLAGAVGDLFSKAGFFETDFSFFNFGGQATSLEMLLGLFERSLSTLHINIFGLLGDLGHDGHFGRCDFRIAPEDRHVVGLISDAIAKLTDV